MLKRLREEAGVTQDELADKLHTNKTTISRIENHAADIKVSTLKKYVEALGRHLSIQLV